MPEPTAEPHCLIIADGEVLIRSAISEYLRHCGYKVIEAANSDEVVTVIKEKSTGIRAILGDADLGGTMNAFELRLWLKKQHPEVHMVLAGNVDMAAKAAGELCDKGPHLKRPYDPQAVSAHIKRLLAAVHK